MDIEMSFNSLLDSSKKVSNSKICVGLDLATYGSRGSNTLLRGQNKLKIITNLIDTLATECCAFKINRQYILDLSTKEIELITEKAHEFKRPIIIDHKLSDIGSTNEQALYHFSQEGFDGFTASPYPGNIQEIAEMGHSAKLASFILVLMSNPEAIWVKNAYLDGLPIFQYKARLADKFADGIVIGTTGHITEKDLQLIKNETHNKVILAPGIGAQGGNMEKLLDIFEEDVIFNVGRSIIYDKDPLAKLRKFNNEVSESGI